MKSLAVIGGGPKAAAICAKAEVINRSGRQVSIRVFEKSLLGAAWSGQHGYSDGVQRLCTPPERDLGFPYERGLLNSAGVRELFGEYSWQAFLVDRARTRDTYRDWVDRGRKPPPHALYARYVRWAILKARFRRTYGTVTGIDHVNGSWDIRYLSNSQKRSFTAKGFDGVVVTGPGDARTGFVRPSDARITDGVAFWRNPAAFIEGAGDSEEPIVIAGSGGTAAAIAAWIAKHSDDRPIIIVGNQAALFTRAESFFENSLFSDEDAWLALEPDARVGVSQRLNRGVVWSSVSDQLSQARNVRFRPGRVMRAYVSAVAGAPEELRVEVKDAIGTRSDPASLVIDASGFDTWWFADLLGARLRRATLKAGTKTQADRRDDLLAAMNPDLSLEIGADGFHAPMLSLAQGPGFASLMVLGAMSERILRSYTNPVT